MLPSLHVSNDLLTKLSFRPTIKVSLPKELVLNLGIRTVNYLMTYVHFIATKEELLASMFNFTKSL
ncbi:hypothetical protein Tsubulata_045712 [Turnera subulata]|uniref:Uncharacterized protein n=1 Tax=Turnera subulata TaxID=218843 RepID=A0A9Q0FD52_9ROSI|nr:hypothetical protein Tsubulata_045712 [Turnera subulata]